MCRAIAFEIAHDKLKLLHRDISYNNVMIVKTPDGDRGILIDWDYAIFLDRASDEVRSERAVSAADIYFPLQKKR
jgi:RIO-like serine/threonine protein kinase